MDEQSRTPHSRRKTTDEIDLEAVLNVEETEFALGKAVSERIEVTLKKEPRTTVEVIADIINELCVLHALLLTEEDDADG